MNTSFYNGISGIKSNQYGIDTLSDNIANVNTIGYKESNAEFSTIFSTTLSDSYFNPTSNDQGNGSRANATTLNLSQGAFQDTDNIFDLAIAGDGWFGVEAQSSKTLYTKAGNFTIDKDGNLVDSSGNYLLGTSANNIQPTTLSSDTLEKFGKYYNGDSSTLANANAITDTGDIALGDINSQTKINLPDMLYYPPDATTKVTYSANLNPEIKLDNDGNEIANSEHFSSTIISPIGNKDILDMTFTKEIPQQTTGSTWDGDIKILSYFEDYNIETYNPTKTYDLTKYSINTDTNTVTKIYDPTKYKIDTTASKVYEIIDQKNAKLEFDGGGKLISSNVPTLSNSGTALTLNLGTPDSYDGFVSSSNFDKTNSESHNGYIEGFLRDYGMDSNGNVVADFDNGRTVPISKVAIYHFQNDQGLSKVGNTLFDTSVNSGKAIFFTDKTGKNVNSTQIYTSKLETSNVNLSTALTELIVMQKAFDASSKSITTSDQMIQNAINMKK